MQKQFFFMKSCEILGRSKIQSGIIIFTIFLHSCQDESLFTSTRWIHCNLQICCTRELENYNFRVNFRVIFVAISVFHVLPYFSKTKNYLGSLIGIIDNNSPKGLSATFIHDQVG